MKKMEEFRLNASKVSLDRMDQAIILSFGELNDAGEILSYVLLQKSSLPHDASGIYIEINDQINSGYKMIRTLKRMPGTILIQLTKPLSNNLPVINISIHYPITAENNKAVEDGLLAIKENT